MRRILTLGFLLLGIPLGAQVTAPAAPPSLAIHGTVVAMDSGMPLSRVRVTAGAAAAAPAVFTDDQGRFSLSLADQASISLHSTKASYLPNTVVVQRAEATRGSDVRVALTRGAVISGRVLDPAGAPVVGGLVMARRAADASATGSTLVLTETDDRGAYRLSGLMAGRYSVLARSRTDPLRQPVFERQARDLAEAAGTAEWSAPLDVHAGDENTIGDLVTMSPIFPLAQSASPAAADQRGTGAVRGRITSSAGQPLAGVTVRLFANGLTGRLDTTRENGAFAFEELPAAAFVLEASKAGYTTVQYGQTRVGEPAKPLVVARGQLVDNVTMSLTGGSAMAGRIVDEHGEPLEGVTVRVLQLRSLGDRTAALSPANARARQTDDRGMYRIYGLLPGRYLLSASTDAGPPPTAAAGGSAYPPTFYPGSMNVTEASALRVVAGLDVEDVNLVLVESNTHRVTGVALDAAGKPAGGRAVLLSVSQRSGAVMVEPRIAQAAADGTFAIDRVPPGDYAVQLTAPPPDAPRLDLKPGDVLPAPLPMDFGMQYVTVVDRDPAPVSVQASRGATIEGRIVFEGAARSSSRLRIGPFPSEFDHTFVVGSGFPGITMVDDEHFRMERVTGPRRFMLSGGDSGVYLKSAVVDGVDTTDTPFDFGVKAATYHDVELVLATASSISGRVVDDRNAPVAGCPVFVLPVDRTRWFRQSQWMKLARTTDDGAFSMTGLPPGAYRIAAVRTLGGAPEYVDDWQSPDVLEAVFSLGTAITLGEGEQSTRALKAVTN